MKKTAALQEWIFDHMTSPKGDDVKPAMGIFLEGHEQPKTETVSLSGKGRRFGLAPSPQECVGVSAKVLSQDWIKA